MKVWMYNESLTQPIYIKSVLKVKTLGGGMKYFLSGCLFFGALNVNAGDLSVNCFRHGDEGDTIQISRPFMANHSIFLEFEYEEDKYSVFAQRESLFKNYSYEVFQVNLRDDSYKKFFLEVAHYDELVKINEDVSCVITD